MQWPLWPPSWPWCVMVLDRSLVDITMLTGSMLLSPWVLPSVPWHFHPTLCVYSLCHNIAEFFFKTACLLDCRIAAHSVSVCPDLICMDCTLGRISHGHHVWCGFCKEQFSLTERRRLNICFQVGTCYTAPRWQLVFTSTSISLAQTCCAFSEVYDAHSPALSPLQSALVSHVRDCFAAIRKLTFLRDAGTYFTLEACVHIHFHITSPNLLCPFLGVRCAFTRIDCHRSLRQVHALRTLLSWFRKQKCEFQRRMAMERHQLRAQTWWNTPEQHTHTTHDLHQVFFAAVKFHYAENHRKPADHWLHWQDILFVNNEYWRIPQPSMQWPLWPPSWSCCVMVLARSLVDITMLKGSTLPPLEGLDGAYHSKANSQSTPLAHICLLKFLIWGHQIAQRHTQELAQYLQHSGS